MPQLSAHLNSTGEGASTINLKRLWLIICFATSSGLNRRTLLFTSIELLGSPLREEMDPKVQEYLPLLQSWREMLEKEDAAGLNDSFGLAGPFGYGTSTVVRLQLFKLGFVQIALQIATSDPTKFGVARLDAWQFFEGLLPRVNSADDSEDEVLKQFWKLNGVALLVDEIERREQQKEEPAELYKACGWLATVDEITPDLLKTGIHKRAIANLASSYASADTKDSSMSFLRTASACYSTRGILRADGALTAVTPFLECLKNSDTISLRMGFRAGSVVARLAGNDEDGIGPQVLRGNPLLIARNVEILNLTLDAGPGGQVFNMLIQPHLITMDLLTIASSDLNKPLLKGSIGVLCKALKLRGEDSEELVVDVVKIFLQLSFDIGCRAELAKIKTEIITLVQRLVVEPVYDLDARMAAQNLINILSAEEVSSPSSITKPSGRLGTLLKAGFKAKTAASREGVVERRKSAAVTGDRHIMLSYNWGSQKLVKRVDDLLRANGIKTWVDYRDMGPNLLDSMAQAVEGASCVVVFMTTKYKESPNCRKECEYANNFKVPITYVMAEKDYNPNGWLGLLLGSSVYISGWDAHLVEANLGQLIERANLGKPAGSPVVVTKASGPASTMPESAASPQLMDTLQAMQAQLQALTESMEEIKRDVKLALTQRS